MIFHLLNMEICGNLYAIPSGLAGQVRGMDLARRGWHESDVTTLEPRADNGKSAIYSCCFPFKAIKTSIYRGCSRIFYMIRPSTVIYRLFRQQLNSWASRFCVTAMFETEGTDYPKKNQWNSVFRDWNCWPSIFLGPWGGYHTHPENMNTNHFCRPTWIALFKVSGCVQPPNFYGKLRAGLLNLCALGQCPTFIWISLIQIWLPLVGMLVIQY